MGRRLFTAEAFTISATASRFERLSQLYRFIVTSVAMLWYGARRSDEA